MSACVIWMDSEHARVFKMTVSGIEKKVLTLNAPKVKGSHHDTHKNNAEEKFFHDVALTAGQVEELLVFGPGMAKTHFKKHLEKHHHAGLAKHLVGVEPLDHLTDNQILESARKYFKKFNTYHAEI